MSNCEGVHVDEKENMKLWESVCTTDPKYTKEVRLGKYVFTDIDAHWNIRRATAKWGPFGSTWGLRDCFYSFIQSKEDVVGIVLQGDFYYPGGAFYIAADMPYEGRGETLKKLQTMCIGKSLSRLGFSADVYMGMFDDSAYVAEQKEKYADRPSADNNPVDSTKHDIPVDKVVGQKPVVENKQKKYPEPDPVASGILGSLAQQYMDLLAIDDMKDLKSSHVVSFKKVCQAVYDAFGKYPTRMDSIPKLLEAVPLDKVIEKNDFLDGIN